MAFETDVGQVASLAQSVRNGPAYTEACSDLSDRKERLNTHVGLGRLAVGDTGATNLASQSVARRGLSILVRMSPVRISRACDARKSRLRRGKLPLRSSGPGGRRFESCLPDQSSASIFCGCALIIFAIVIVRTAGVSRRIGGRDGLCGGAPVVGSRITRGSRSRTRGRRSKNGTPRP